MSNIKFLLGILFLTQVLHAEMGVPIQLRLKAPGGSYPTEAGINVKLLVLSPASSCILREENFSAQTINNGNLSLNLGTGTRGTSDPNLTLNQVYDNSKAKTGLSCVDANNNITSTGQSYTPGVADQRVFRISTTVSADPIIVNFSMRSTPYAIQAESVGGKSAAELIVNDPASQMNQTNLNDLLQDVTRFNNLKTLAVNGQSSTATNFSGSLAGDVSGTQSATSVDKIKGVAVSGTAPSSGQVLQYNGTQYVPTSISASAVTSVAGRTGAVVLSNSDISGLGGAAVLNVGTTAGSVAAGNDSRIVNAIQSSSATPSNTPSTIVARDGSGNFAATTVSATNNSTQNIYLYDSTNASNIHLKAPASFTSYVLTLPVADGSSGQVLKTDGSGNLFFGNVAAGGTVNSVTATSPVSSSGGANPDISIAQATTSTSGYLSSADWNLFNSKLSAGNNLSDLASAATARTNLGLGGAALLNVGTAAGSVAAGNDARITGALQASAFNATLTSASCTTSQSLYWNSVSSQFLCQAIAFPADAVSSVAGRTGAVVLSNADISGLGGAATLNVGTSAGSVAAGDDSRIVNSIQTSTAHSGDVTGNISALTVARIRGVAVAATAPANGDVLQFNGTQYVPVAIPSAPVSSVAGRTGAVVLSPADLSVPTCAAGQYLTYDGSAWSCATDQVGGAGGITGISATAPLSSTGGASPNFTISQATTTTNGYLSSADWNIFNSKQNALGYTPLNPASNLSDLASAATARTNLGLGGSATLNVGSAAGTVAAGNDARMVNALQTSTAHAGDVSGTASTMSVDKIKGIAVSATAPTANQVLQYNGAQYVPSTLPSAPVTTVAGRTGAVVLSNADISGLGGAAVLNVGTAAGTVAAGNDARMVNAVQTSSALAGDASGTISTISVDKIKGIAVSATAPVANQVLQYNGTQYVPSTLPSAPVTTVAGRTGAVVLSNADISGLGGAALLNVGSAAGTVAAGNDARITGALSAATFNGYVASSNCTTSQSLYWNSVSSQFLCQAIAFPADAVSSVAGRTGAVVLSNTDITGLGGAAVLNVGTAAGTVAAGNDARMVNAVQTSSALSGDASGTISTISVDKIKGVVVSATAPTANQVLQFNGTQYVPSTLPSAPVTTVAGRTGAVVLSNTDITGLGGAAVLNVGTAAGTVAAGNDARMVNALQTSTAHSGDVSGTASTMSVDKIKGVVVSATAPTANQVLQFNGTQYVPSTLPSAPVTTVAGRTGAVVLSNADISGLGGAAVLNVGTAAGTVAAGNDARMVNAVQTSTVHSGDVSGTTATMSVDKIKGVVVSATAPTANQVLQFNGTQYVPSTLPSAPVTTVAGRTGAVVLSNTDITGLGGAAVLNVGTAAGTVAAGNDSRIVNAVQTSSTLSGDASGTISTLSVDKIKGVAVSATAPTANQVLQFNGTQYVPSTLPSAPVTTVAGRTGAVVLSNTDITGLGGAALLNVGTAVSTVAAGNDARITGALQSSAFNGYVSSSSCTTAQTLYWNSVSSQFLCQAIAFPADAVSSVAGRTGAVVLASSDISGLGTAAGLNVGVATNNVVQLDGAARIPASTLPAIALTTSSVVSGDVSGTSSTLSVNALRGRTVSATAPVAGQALVYNGTQWVPTTGFPNYVRATVDQIFSVTAVANVTQLFFPVVAGNVYKYRFNVMYTSAATTTGLRLGLTYPAVTTATGLANIASGADGTGAYYQGVINSSGDSVMALNTPAAAPNAEFAVMEGIIVPTASGNVQLISATEVAGSNITIKAGSFVEFTQVP